MPVRTLQPSTKLHETLATSNPTLSAQLYHAAILLIGNSTKSTKEALQTAGVAGRSQLPGAVPEPIVPPPAPVGAAPAKTGGAAVAIPASPNAVAASAEPTYGERIVTPPIPDTTIVTPTGESTLVADPIQFTTKISQLK